MILPIGLHGGLNKAGRTHRAGLSLIELILVMAILAAVAAIVVPRLSGFSRGRENRAAWDRFVAVLRYARSEAISRSVPVTVRFDLEQGSYELTGGYGWKEPPGAAAIYQLPKRLTFEFPDAVTDDTGRVSILFQPDGSVDDQSPTTIQLVERDGDVLHTLCKDAVLGYAAPTEENSDYVWSAATQ